MSLTDPRRFGKQSIRFRMACLVMACVLPVWAGAAILGYHLYQQRRSLLEKRVLETTRALSMLVDQQFATMQASATALATSPALATGDFATFYKQAHVVIQDFPGCDVNLADATGQQFINSYVPFGTPLPKRHVSDVMRKVFETGKPSITNMFQGALTGRRIFAVEVPVFIAGQVKYDLVFAWPVEHFTTVFSQQGIPPEWTVTIQDANHVLVARSRFPERFVGTSAQPAAMKRMAEADEGSIEYPNQEGIDSISVFHRSAISGWLVVITIPKTVITADVWQWLKWMLGGIVLLSIAAIALALFLAERTGGSIRALIAPALALGSGEPVEIGQLDLKETDEVGQSLVKASQLLQQRTAERERAEQASQKLAAIVESSDEAIIGKTLDGTITSWNRGAQQLYGYTAQEVLGRHISILLQQGQTDEMPHLLEQLRKGVTIEHYETLRQRKDGNVIPVLVKISPIQDTNGVVVGASSFAHDITERKRAEEALRRQADLLRLSFDAIIVWQFDGSIESWNLGAERLYGFSEEEALGRVTHELLATIHPKPWSEIRADLLQNRVWEGELRHHKRDGSEVIVSARKQLIRYADGSEHVLEANRDITEHKRAEEALHQSEDRWSTTLRSIGDAVISTCAQGKVMFMNEVAEKLTGWPLAEAQGHDLSEVFNIVSEVTRIKPESPVSKVVRMGQVVGLANHTALISRNGTEFPIEDSGAPILGNEGQITGVVLVFHDISEKRRAERAVRDSERLAMTGRMASTLAHEIHNPLDTVGSLLYLIEQDADAPETVRRRATMASEEVTRVTQMTRHMLSFQREAKTPVPIKIGEVLDNVIALYERKIESSGIQVEKQVEFEGEFIGLPGEMRQVFANLVSNAIEAIGKNGKIRLHAYASRDWRQGRRGLRVTVADNGPGIPAEVRDKIFDPFFTTKGEAGTGLGLWIISGIVGNNDGILRVRTICKDGRSGTCFSVFFPFADSSGLAQG